ncbi:unnamed protein product [Chrysodeixis includens]|uniref:Uncharacterized protein n=1 Tax=Chrysodeixis includens TaxID=689277 RepID=A0A9P0BMI9_CHRIL|nr:unnamed protein product [Chrysodeixis includens]
MKWLFYVIVFVYMFYRSVYGLKPVENGLILDPVTYGDEDYLKVGAHKTISCKATNRNQKVEWIDPYGKVVKHLPTNRIFSQEHFVAAMRGRAPALVLTITNAVVKDTGVYTCRSGNIEKNVSLCVVDPSDFVDTQAEVAADLGRSITLSCQAKGDPEPRLLWSRNGETITDEETPAKYRLMTKYNIQGFEGLLTITSLEPEDSGIYSCVSIQEHPQAEDCSHSKTFNITLNVNYAPIFEDGNDTKLVYAKENQLVDIPCSAAGFPTPAYRWFKDIGDEVLFEFDKKQIKLNEDDTQAVLSVKANQSTFGQRFKCQASNDHGASEKYFVLLKIETPVSPKDVSSVDSSSDSVQLQVTWYGEIQFPISAFIVQYLKVSGDATRKTLAPKEAAFKRSEEIVIEKYEDAEDSGFVFELEGLEEDSTYWVRVKVQNDAGESLWSIPTKVATTVQSSDDEETTTVEAPEAEPETTGDEEPMSDGTFYGIFFAVGIFVVSFVCMFAMRMVK